VLSVTPATINLILKLIIKSKHERAITAYTSAHPATIDREAQD